MKGLFAVALGILTAIGGFVDIGDLVTNGLVGSRFGMSLAWVVVVGVIGICLYAEMCGRVVAISGRPVFDLVRDRLGERAALANLLASSLITFLTLAAEIGGVALAIELATSVNYLLWVPIVGFLAWLVIWKLPFSVMENVFGLVGLTLVVFVVALVQLNPDWRHLADGALHPSVPTGEGHPTAIYYAIGLFGATMTPYEVFFFSSGGVEEGWTAKSIKTMRLNVFLGFPLGGLLSTGYTVAQDFGWSWGKFVKPVKAARFHTVVLLVLVAGLALVLTTIDPVKVTEYSVVLSAAALPLTYRPILVVANDRRYLGDKVNGRVTNTIATVYLLIILVVAAVTIPFMLVTKAGL